MPTQNQSDGAKSDLPTFDVSKSELLNHLRNQIRGIETAGRMEDGSRVSSGSPAIDRLLPAGGYQRGTLVQWLTGGGQSADYLSLLVARQACADGGALVVFDPQHQFYPPAAAAIGINLDNLIMLRTNRPADVGEELHNDLLWSIDQALRCPAVAAVWGPIDHINQRWFRRFQLSAESSGCLGLFVQPICEARQPSWAEVQWLVSRVRWSRNDRIRAEFLTTNLVRLQLIRCRGAQTGKTVNLSINNITGNVQLARRDHEKHQRENRNDKRQTAGEKSSATHSADPVSLVSQLAHSAVGRQRA